MTFVETYFKYRNRYYGQTLGEAFCNHFWSHVPLHKNQQKLFDQKDDAKAAKKIQTDYRDLNESFNGDIYDQTFEASPPPNIR